MLQRRFPVLNMRVLPVGPIEPFDWDMAPNCLGDASNAGVASTLYNTLLTAMLSTALQYVLSQLTYNVSLQTGPLLLLQCHSSLPGHLHGHRSALPSAALLHHIRACQAHQSSWTTCRQGDANQVGLHDVNLCAKPCVLCSALLMAAILLRMLVFTSRLCHVRAQPVSPSKNPYQLLSSRTSPVCWSVKHPQHAEISEQD